MTNYCKINISGFKLTVDKVHNNCKYYKEGDILKLNSLPKNICIIALHTALPYYFTLLEGGWFRWEKNKNMATAFCPVAKSSIGMDVTRTKRNSIKIRIRETNNCIKNYNINQFQKLDFFEKSKLCPRMLFEILPYIFYLNSSKKNEKTAISTSCSSCKYGRVDLILSKK